MRLHLSFHPLLRALPVACLLAWVILSFAQARQAAQQPAEKLSANASVPAEPQNPAQIELLETRYRFEANGDSRKEVHARVHINSELGVRQFARLNFDYNRAFQSIDIPLVRITHPSGGTADILPSAITDNPNPAVINAPAYQDVRVKSVRILGLAPGDNLEYRIVTITTHHPLAPDFWLDHSFDRFGVVTEEHFEIDVPASRKIQLHVRPEFTYEINESETATDARVVYIWRRINAPKEAAVEPFGDVLMTTFPSWNTLAQRLVLNFLPRAIPGDDLSARATELTRGAKSPEEKLQALYDFVSKNIRTVDLPLGALGYSARHLNEIVDSGYGNSEEKAFLLAALCQQVGISANPALADPPDPASGLVPSPSIFSRILVRVGKPPEVRWLDVSLEVAPLGAVQANLRGKRGFLLVPAPEIGVDPEGLWPVIPAEIPFASVQHVRVNASLAADGKLTAKVHYSMRGDNELLLRVAFHQAPKEKWKDLAQLLSLSDGFRGTISSANTSDPYATREPFTVDYEISMPKFVDWSKKPLRIPALLPQLGLPDLPAKPAPGTATSPIDLGTPLEVETHMTLHLPPGTMATPPTGTAVQRDYATFASQYSAKGLTATASRRIHFLLKEVPADRAADYNAFLRAVLNDESQDFTLDHQSLPAPATKPAAPTANPETVNPKRAPKRCPESRRGGLPRPPRSRKTTYIQLDIYISRAILISVDNSATNKPNSRECIPVRTSWANSFFQRAHPFVSA